MAIQLSSMLQTSLTLMPRTPISLSMTLKKAGSDSISTQPGQVRRSGVVTALLALMAFLVLMGFLVVALRFPVFGGILVRVKKKVDWSEDEVTATGAEVEYVMSAQRRWMYCSCFV